jgi:CHAT domain
MQPPINQLYKFGQFCLDVSERVLRRDRRVASLSPKLFDTRLLMVPYYGGLKQGQGRGEALRRAPLEMLKCVNRRHPYYWASIIRSGEWANLEGKR